MIIQLSFKLGGWILVVSIKYIFNGNVIQIK